MNYINGEMNKIRGVNLGGWLVLEKWICEDPFVGTQANDEEELFANLTPKEFEKRLKKHRNSFIQEIDIEKIASYGMNLIRLPIPYTVMGANNRSSCIEYVDKLFTWANKYNLKILLDLHTVPGGQNGLDNSVVTGLCTWHKNQDKVIATIDLLELIAKRYANHNSFYGIELLNEPISEERFNSLKKRIAEKYDDRIKSSEYVPTTFLVDFYTKCYNRLDKVLNDNQKIVIHDGFRLSEWSDLLPKEQFPKIIIDTHMYLNFISRELKKNCSQYYIEFIFTHFLKELRCAAKYHPIIVGEWTLAHHQGDKNEMNSDMYRNYMRAICNLQKMAYEISVGWTYFNYRVDDSSRKNWDLNHVIREKYFSM